MITFSHAKIFCMATQSAVTSSQRRYIRNLSTAIAVIKNKFRIAAIVRFSFITHEFAASL